MKVINPHAICRFINCVRRRCASASSSSTVASDCKSTGLFDYAFAKGTHEVIGGAVVGRVGKMWVTLMYNCVIDDRVMTMATATTTTDAVAKRANLDRTKIPVAYDLCRRFNCTVITTLMSVYNCHGRRLSDWNTPLTCLSRFQMTQMVAVNR